MRSLIGTIFLLLAAGSPLWAQVPKDSTIQLEIVEVRANSATRYLSGTQSIKVDSSFLFSQSNALLSESLQLISPMYFRNRGAGMLSSLTLRGTSPQHTNVLWNGLQINSFSLGQMDFSLLPVAAFSDIELHLGGGGTQFGSGAIGGSLLLENKPKSTNGYGLDLMMGAGSIGQRNVALGTYYKDNKWAMMIHTYRLSSKNNFEVRPLGYVQPNAAWEQLGILTHTAYQFSQNSNMEFSFWQHQANREIQLPIGSRKGGNKQQDSNHRMSLKWNQKHDHGKYSAQLGYVKDNIIFNGSGGAIERFIAKSVNEFRLPYMILLSTDVEWNRIWGHLENYGSTLVEDRIDVSLSMLKQWSNGASLSLNSRKPWVSEYNTPYLFFAGLDVPIFAMNATNQLNASGSLSNNFRVPTLNDRFWLELGRPDLNPEQSLNAEVGLSWSQKGLEILRINAYRYLVDDWIQWVPTSAGQWRPENVQQVLSQGLEISASKSYSISTITFHSKWHYGYTSSTVRASVDEKRHQIGRQLIYTPLHQGNWIQQIYYGKWWLQLSYQMTGLRYTTSDNSTDFALDAFGLLDLQLNYQWKYGFQAVDLCLKANNLTNTNYQLFINHAMPGRHFLLQLNYKLNKRT